MLMSSNFAIYMVGYLVVTAGIVYALHALGLGQQWIIATSLIMVGVGIVAALTRSKKGDVADAKVDNMNH